MGESEEHKTNRRFVIIGATGGVGSALSRRLASDGADLMLAARGEDRLSDLAEELGARRQALDATDFDTVEALVRDAYEAFGGVDGVVSLPGSLLLKPAHLTSAEELAEALSQNITTAFAAVRAVGKVLRQGPASVVLMSSAVAHHGLANHEAIAAAKGGVAALARSAAATYAGRGVRVNALAPGLVQSPLTERITSSDAALESSRKMHALGRVGQPGDPAALIRFLLSRESDWITGQVIGVDGGLSSVAPG